MINDIPAFYGESRAMAEREIVIFYMLICMHISYSRHMNNGS